MNDSDSYTDISTKPAFSMDFSLMSNHTYGLPNEPSFQTLISPSSSSVDEEPDQDIDSDGISTSPGLIDPEPYISNQFYTFNSDSHHLMVHCILQSRYASPDEIKTATPSSVLKSWRGVWKDRNVDTAYSTGWRRIQDKLKADVDGFGSEVLYFKNNPNQFVPYVNQWQDIAFTCHSDSEFRHLGLKETIDKIKQVWTVGAKFYGIPESFIKACISNCSVCRSDGGSSSQRKLKRRRFEYTDTFEVPAREVAQKLQQLATKHKVVLCIRQKYIRYKPFMAEVKDYCCHRAGEPNMKKQPGLFQRKRYSSKRCGCGFRIRAIVPIKDYNQKDKSFSYVEEGKAVFKVYAVHSGHEPGPHEGSARIIHRFVGPANKAIEEGTVVYVCEEGNEGEEISMVERVNFGNFGLIVFKQLEELKSELRFLVERIPKFSKDVLGSLSLELNGITQRLSSIGEMSECDTMIVEKLHSGEGFLDDPSNLSVVVWNENPGSKNSSDAGTLIDGHVFLNADNDDSQRKIMSNENVVGEDNHVGNIRLGKWDLPPIKEPSTQFADSASFPCESAKICKDLVLDVMDDIVIPEEENLATMNVDGYYHESIKWYLDQSSECGDHLSIAVQEGFRHAVV